MTKFEVASNVDWTVMVDETWFTASPSIGYANGTVNVNVSLLPGVWKLISSENEDRTVTTGSSALGSTGKAANGDNVL